MPQAIGALTAAIGAGAIAWISGHANRNVEVHGGNSHSREAVRQANRPIHRG